MNSGTTTKFFFFFLFGATIKYSDGKGDIDATYRKKGPTDVRARDGWYIGMVLYCINEAVNVRDTAAWPTPSWFFTLFFVVCTCTSTSTLKQNPKRIYFLHIAGVPRSSRRYAHWASHCQLIIYQILNFCWAQIYSSTRFHSSTVVPERVTRSLSEIWLRKSQNIANGNNYHGY